MTDTIKKQKKATDFLSSAHLTKLLIVIVMMYSFSIQSYYAIIPETVRIVLLLGMPLALSLLLIFTGMKRNLRVRISATVVSAVCMIIVMLIWNNHTIRAEGLAGMFGQLMPMVFFLAIYKRNDWYNICINIMIAMGMFYTMWTFICLISPSVYYSGIAPLMKSLYPNIGYDVDSKAGFTAHYSTNGMYLANGIIACISRITELKKNRAMKNLRWYYAMLVLNASAFLICGKRGILLCLVFACYFTYFIYNFHRQRGKMFKAAVFSLIIIMAVYIASLIVPSLANAYNRMQLMISKGDVSTGRFDLWAAGWDAFRTSPIVGHGWRWFYYYDTTVFMNYDIHNCYIQFLAELGIVGSIPFYTFFFVNIYRTIKLAKINIIAYGGSSHKEHNYGYMTFALLYQAFFLAFIFESTAFYNPEALVPYVVSCAMTENNYMKKREINKI